MSRHATLRVALDPDRVGELLGADVRVTRLRHKPGQYTVAALADATGPTGWLRLTPHQDRAARDAERAARVGRRVEVVEADGLVLVHGDLWTDPRLARVLHRAADLVDASVVVRHNPLRRLVLRRGTTQIRVTTKAQPDVHRLVPALAEEGLAAAPRGRASSRVTRWEWVPGESLDAVSGRGDLGARRAGEIAGGLLARLHQVPVPAGAHERLPQRAGWDDGGLRATARGLADVDAELGARAAGLVDRLPAVPVGAPVLLHGDWSSDQLVVGEHGARMIDLDRAGSGPALRDLASYLAVEALRTGDPEGSGAAGLRTGYEEGGGSWPGDAAVRSASAAALLSRVKEPLRRAEPTWRDGVGRTLDLAEELLR